MERGRGYERRRSESRSPAHQGPADRCRLLPRQAGELPRRKPRTPSASQERLILEVWTNGVVTPETAVATPSRNPRRPLRLC